MCALALLVAVSAVFGDAGLCRAENPQIVSIDVGLSGYYKAGHWTPIRVALRAGDQPLAGWLSVIVPDGDGVPSRIVAPRVKLEPGRATATTVFARFGRLANTVDVELRAGTDVVAERRFLSSPAADGDYRPALPSTLRLIATIGEDSAGVEQAIGTFHQEASEKTVVVRFDTAQSLPAQWYGLESADAVVLATSNPQRYAGLLPDAPQMEALDRWVRMGGKLLLAVGSRAEAVLNEAAPLARFAPGRLLDTVVLRQTGSLEAYAGGTVAVPPGPTGRVEIRAPRFENVEGIVEVREGNLPLVIRRAWGFGQVIFLAADLDAPSLGAWPDRGLLVAKLLDLAPSAAGESREGSEVMHYGYTDISGQMRRALDQYAGVVPFSFWIVGALVGLYLVLIGPVDYFLLRRFSPRMEFTWITFPLIVTGFSVAAYLLGVRFKGEEVRVNQVNLIDVDAESKQIRGTWWGNVFSPRMDRYQLTVTPSPLGTGDPSGECSVLFSWLGLPGQALGGMDPAAASAVGIRQPYTFSRQLDAVDGVPIQTWASKSFTSRWYGPAEDLPEARLADEDGVPAGTVINTLDFPLADCLLVYGRWTYQLGDLKPGQAARVGPMVPRRELRTLLTGRRFIRDEDTDQFQQEATPYDTSSTDPAYILRMMMFFEAGGGRQYTGLMNRYQNFVDLTGLLKTDRAILIASVPAAEAACHGAALVLGGKRAGGARDRQMSVYRFVFPVEQESGGDRKVPLFRDRREL